MYQQNPGIDLSYLDDPQGEFSKLITLFKDNIGFKYPELLERDEKEYDLSKNYIINWACIWNKVSNVGRQCIIVQKDDQIALVVFPDDMEITQDKFYRLEDLTPQ